MGNGRRLTLRIVLVVLLCLLLSIASFAAGYYLYRVSDNQFQTGTIDIDLNGGAPVITAGEYLFEPGVTVEKEFYIQNNSTWAVYFRLFFEEDAGALGDILLVTLLDADGTELHTGRLNDFTDRQNPIYQGELAVDQRRVMTLRFHFPEEAGNRWQAEELEFRLSAVAVQTKNNPDKEFD